MSQFDKPSSKRPRPPKDPHDQLSHYIQEYVGKVHEAIDAFIALVKERGKTRWKEKVKKHHRQHSPNSSSNLKK